MIWTKTRVAVALAFASGAVLWLAREAASASRGRGDAPPEELAAPPEPTIDPTGEAASPSPSGAESLGYVVGLGIPVWMTETFRQEYYLTDFRYLEVRDEKKDPQTGEWVKRTHSATSSFDIIWEGQAHQDLFCFAGFGENGDFVLERWELKPVMTETTGPGGVKVVVVATDENGMDIKRFHRAEIFRGPLAIGVFDVEFDLEERFMMALVEVGENHSILYRFENEVGATPIPVLDSMTVPELVEMRSLAKFDHGVLGRVWAMEDQIFYNTMILLGDGDNDGIFDGAPIIGDQAFMKAAGLFEPHLWDDLLGP